MRRLGLIGVAVLALGACQQKPAELTVENAWVRLSATPNGPAAAYFIVRGGMVDDRLIAVTSENAIRSELHESMKSGGMASMKPLADGVPVPAKSTVTFEPGGRHVMLFDINPALKPPRTTTLTLTFASGARFKARAVLRQAGGA